MSELLPLNPDELLTTTRSVRKRLDLTRPVPMEIIREALEVALQAPTGSNSQTWHWIVVTDPETKRKIADLYRKSFEPYIAAQNAAAERRGDETGKRVASSASYLAEVLHEVPALVIGAIFVGRADCPKATRQGSGDRCFRVRGACNWRCGRAGWDRHGRHCIWRTSGRSPDLGIPDTIAQGVLLPVAYYTGDGFKPAPRKPLDDILHIDRW